MASTVIFIGVPPSAYCSSLLHFCNAIGCGKCVGKSCYELRGMKGFYVMIINAHKSN